MTPAPNLQCSFSHSIVDTKPSTALNCDNTSTPNGTRYGAYSKAALPFHRLHSPSLLRISRTKQAAGTYL